MKTAFGVAKYASLSTVFVGGVGLIVAPGLTVGATLLAGTKATAAGLASGASWSATQIGALAGAAPAAA